jgi:signal transduction histidine kinase
VISLKIAVYPKRHQNRRVLISYLSPKKIPLPLAYKLQIMEINHRISFNPAEVSLLNMHSVLNVLNVVQYDLLRLSDYLENPSETEKICNALFLAGEDLNNPEKAYRRLDTIHELCDSTLAVCEKVLKEKGKLEEPFCTEILMNLTSVFAILKVRAQEIKDRKTQPTIWIDHDIEELKNNFKNAFQAIEENSDGDYHIVYNLAEHFEKEYVISLEITSANNTGLFMPPVFQDVMRDLLANARKYSVPGGFIAAGLHQGKDEMHLVVEDSGAGIPADEISKVVAFGYRASNSKSPATRGGGFGLSKAYHLSQSFGGKMFIDSPAPGRTNGTKISISLPLPQ